MRYILCQALILLSAVASWAQENTVELYGYFEPQITAQYTDPDVIQIQSNKLRVDIASRISDRITFKANYDFITYHGTTELNYLDFLPPSVAGTVPAERYAAYALSFTDRSFLDNAFMKIAFEKCDLTVGKQQISPGTGYAWNPTDLYNTKDVFDPTYEQPGHSAFRLDVPLGGVYSVLLLYLPDDTMRNSGKILRFAGRAGHFDYSVTGGERLWTYTDFSSLVATQQMRRMVGGDFAGEIFGVGVWGEAAYNDLIQEKDFFEGLLGLDFTFDSELYVMGEYYRNEQGKNRYQEYDLTVWLRNFTTETRAISRDQVYLYARYPVTDLFTAGGSLIASMNDGSAVIVPYLQYNMEENLDVTFFGSVFLGSDGRAFSSDLGSGGTLRARYYF